MLSDGLLNQLGSAEFFFNNVIEGLGEDQAGFAPAEGMMTLAQQVAHTAHTIDWFIEGMFESFDENWDAHEAKVRSVTTWAEATEWLRTSFENARVAITGRLDDELRERLPPGAIMGNAPRYVVMGALVDHTAHHRGSIATYLRVMGRDVPLPYGD